jgi:hypothetical protein
VRRQLPFAVRPGGWVAVALAVLAGLSVLGILGYSWARPALLPHLVRVQEARPGKLETVVSGQAAVIWDEWVLTAPAAGLVRLEVGEGERVRTGTPVCWVDGHQVISPGPGVVSLVTDGTEGHLPVAPGSSPPATQVLALKPQPHRLRDGQAVTLGQALARVVDASRMRLCVVLPPADVAGLAARARVLVRLPGGREITMQVEAHHPGDDRTYGTLTLVSPEWEEELLRARLIMVEVVRERATGLIIPRRALVEREGQPGVFVVKKTMAQWVRVELRGEKGGLVAVGGIPEGSQVITNPWLVREGAIVR